MTNFRTKYSVGTNCFVIIFYYLDCTKCKFPDFSLTFPNIHFSLAFNKIPWLFPDFCQVWNFPDFSLTAGHPVFDTLDLHTLWVRESKQTGKQWCTWHYLPLVSFISVDFSHCMKNFLDHDLTTSQNGSKKNVFYIAIPGSNLAKSQII